MKRLLPLLALAPIAVSSREARADDTWGYVDVLSPEMVGELRSHTYDLNQQVDKDTSQFVGNQTVGGGRFLGGGFGVRGIVGGGNGFFGGGEAYVGGGRITGADLPWASTSTAMHYTVLGEVGWALPVKELLSLHAAAVFGFDGMRFDVANPQAPVGAATTAAGGMAAAPGGFTLSRFELRAGVQIGVHINLYKVFGVFADGTIDYDGEYRIRFGLAFGCPRD